MIGMNSSSRLGGWLVPAGAAAALYAVWAACKARRPGAVGAHAWLVPTDQARTEAARTRRAVQYTSEAKAF